MFTFSVVSVFAISVFASQIICDKLSDSIRKCYPGDNVCIVDTCNNILHNERNDFNVSFDPFIIPIIRLKPDLSRPVNVDFNLTDIKIHGLRQFDIYKIKGFTDNISGSNEIHLKGGRLELNGKYVLDGKVIIIPIHGNGDVHITIIEPDFQLKFNGKSTFIGGQQYMQTDNMKVKITVKGLIYQFDNLYNGDKVLGEATNQFLNEHWKDIFLEIKPALVKTLKEQIQKIANDAMSKLPFEEYFLKHTK